MTEVRSAASWPVENGQRRLVSMRRQTALPEMRARTAGARSRGAQQ
jgi:hypothetical protein